MDRFPVCHPITSKWEGGWSDHPADPGGKTMYGITEVRWHEYQRKMGMKLSPVRNVTKAQALTFYRSEFWEACGAPNLFPGVDLAVYDASVNSGVSRGKKWLWAAMGSNDHSETVRKICRARLSFMQSLKIWKTFGKGWGRRVADIEVRGVAMAMAAMGATPTVIRTEAAAHAVDATHAKNNAAGTEKITAAGAAGSGSGSAVAASSPTTVSDFDYYTAIAVMGGVAAILVLVLIVINVRKRAAAERALAYDALASSGPQLVVQKGAEE
jgi:lysozyme family protein